MTAETDIIIFKFISIPKYLHGESYPNKQRKNLKAILSLPDLFHRKIPYHYNYFFIKAVSVYRGC